ncbi:GntR family transcriptional regulator [Saccharopolyspora gregorii]|uniref:GntR family transcriptional regulator n=1 Tax=Saccharopolyspora gregorii TaxID=33914 RepID=A0ABP6RTF9_9PSEU|nr:GntR family transcriptional regulator [Saccharopolyspora gregorii]
MPGAGLPHRRPRPQLSDEVASRIRDRIVTGLLRKGEHLHLERLAEEIGVSVTPVREALLALRGEGFVELEPRRGFTVLPLNRKDIEDTSRVQAAIAGELAARTAALISVGQLAGLEEVQAELEHAGRFGIGDAAELDLRFHHAIYDIADSAKLAWFVQLTSRYVPRELLAATEDHAETTGSEHRAILRALHNRDPEAARRAMHEHLAHHGQVVIRRLDQQGFWER